MTAPWQELSRTELEEMILAALTRQWITPKQLAPLIGVPWRVLMRALPRLYISRSSSSRIRMRSPCGTSCSSRLFLACIWSAMDPMKPASCRICISPSILPTSRLS